MYGRIMRNKPPLPLPPDCCTVGYKPMEPGNLPLFVSAQLIVPKLICLTLFVHFERLAASRTFCTAGSSSPMRIAMIAITTSSSISVNAARPRFRKERNIKPPEKREKIKMEPKGSFLFVLGNPIHSRDGWNYRRSIESFDVGLVQ